MRNGGGVTGSLLRNIVGVHWDGLAGLGKKIFECECADVGFVGWVGNRGILELDNVPEEVPMDTEKPRLKNGEVDSKVGE